ncbi:hypothetical protein K443DRAFT_10802 [Laccaria amethystina LaAM-08-1]|uniref:Uncharacterized protein n=1 Tax=Laccaria amethystina LaAM-08-1 TaxID=1095629 RepID=A0A0C9XEQ9_9AGAR|nr:hypothetical protein K443DRAFT_10802 [Laccaria amethystina LaAM-08-1]
MPPKKSTKSLPATADTHAQQSNQPDTALKPDIMVLAALREEEELGSMNDTDESNPEAGEEDDESDPAQEIPIAVPRKRAKASKHAATPKKKAKKTTEQGSDAGNPPTTPVPPVVLGSLVQSGLLSKFDKTGTGTGLCRLKNYEKPD